MPEIQDINQELNERLIRYNEELEAGTFKIEELEQMLEDYFNSRIENKNKAKLLENMNKIKSEIAEYYDCTEEEIFIGDINFSDSKYTKMPYKVIIGSTGFMHSKIPDFGDLKFIGGNLFVKYAKMTSLKKIQKIMGNVNMYPLTDLGDLQMVGGNIYFTFSRVNDLKKLQIIGGYADFRLSEITDLANLQIIGGGANFCRSSITNFGNLQRIEGEVFFDPGSELEKLYYEQFENGVRKTIVDEENVSVKR